MNYLILFLIIIVIHEFGHWIGFKAYGHNPNIKLKWWGIQIGENIKSWKITKIELYFACIMGIFLGYIPIVIYIWMIEPLNKLLSISLTFIYFAMCIFDIMTIMQIFPRNKKDGNMLIYTHIYNGYLIEKKELENEENE